VVRPAELGQPSLPAGQRAQGADAATSSSSSAVDLSSDPRWRKYTALVDKALASFDSVKEWADFIAFLARLLRTLQAQQPAFDEIPRKLLVAKRLAQCLTPSLPSGVHQRALDVYGHILQVIGVRRPLCAIVRQVIRPRGVERRFCCASADSC